MGAIKTNTNIRTSIAESISSLIFNDGTYLMNGYTNSFGSNMRQVFLDPYTDLSGVWTMSGKFLPVLILYIAYPTDTTNVNKCGGFTFDIVVQKSKADLNRVDGVSVSIPKAVAPDAAISGSGYNAFKRPVTVMSNQPITVNTGNTIDISFSSNNPIPDNTAGRLKYNLILLPVN